MELTTLRQAHARDAAYWGDYPDYLIAYARHRDSDSLTNCNFQVFESEFNRIDPDGETWTIEGSSHWAVGWIDYLAVKPGSEAESEAIELLTQIENYPVLDDEKLTLLEMEQVELYWADLPLKWRIEELARNNESIFAARADAWELYDRAPHTYEHLEIECNR